ncbi:hypothetical protein LZZ90_02820 [Flavobacterium sp. SM15]|uniref:hypothetical protein n=1 Tax=Flavobacterium sp. SM15 TaxID=2908005 RepID=UPI001EDB1DAB|nr:hypothetical protein [Flavobacterium sp. SM15]MCG2610439.1 hypothetical protein [Flavobacterium sp. SM15]
MKAITVLASMVVVFSSCNCQKTAAEQPKATPEKEMVTQQTIPTLEYEESTRGFFRSITVVNQTVAVISVRNGEAKTTKISDTDWKELTALYQKVNNENLAGLKAPTEKRFYDGAPIARLRVMTKEKEFESAPFDGGFPPAEIEQIINKLIAIADKQQ